MPSLFEYFQTDFSHFFGAHQSMAITGQGFSLEFTGRVLFDPMANCRFISAFVPSSNNPLAACVAIVQDHQKILDVLKDLIVKARLPGENLMDIAAIVFTRRVFIYCEDDLPESDLKTISGIGDGLGLPVQFRGPEFARQRTAIEKPMGFICHDSRDKESVAKPLAIELIKMMCPVWYDEFSLSVGDDIRVTIEKGIKQCPKIILVVSTNFLSNERWARREYDAAFLKEVLEGRSVMLPVWCGVTEKQVFDYSPGLAGKHAVKWEVGLPEVARKLRSVLVA